MKTIIYRTSLFLVMFFFACNILIFTVLPPIPVHAQGDTPNPPATVVKLIFIHHSSGENWLSDENGGLGRALGDNNYFVSDTNYGWGPDSIGDRTDIINWPEWFRGPDSARYLVALFAESEQHAAYTRRLADPGGENQIIMFKSCFPNSNLEGSPGDPPVSGGDALTLSNAKFIYNELLQYFITRPDKLFVVITAPPVIDPTLAANARAFNTWLVRDWLRENSYPYSNVAVFDFYNVLTGGENHHRFLNGAVEYINNRGQDSAFYPSPGGDDHPSSQGNRKATQEFVPLLNVFFNRWKAALPPQPPGATALPQQPPVSMPPALLAGMVDSFEGGVPANTSGWESYWDNATDTAFTCTPAPGIAHDGNSALHIDFNVAAGSWATCILSYGAPQNWSGSTGLSFFLQASQAGLPVNVLVYSGTPENQETYEIKMTIPPEAVNGWARVDVPWSDLLRVEWETGAGTPFNQTTRVMGTGFGFDGLENQRSNGTIWVDGLSLSGAAEPVEEESAAPVKEPGEEQEEQTAGGAPWRNLPCACPFALTPGIIGLVWIVRHKRNPHK